MSFIRIINSVLAAAVVALVALTGCEEKNVPDELRLPILPSANAQVIDGSVVLSAEFKSAEDKAAVKEFGFYFGTNETLLERLNVTESVGLGYSLTMGNLEYSTSYFYRVWVSNGRHEISSQLMTIKTGEAPVDPDPPVEGIIRFKDPAVKAICVANWDLNADGELSKDEAEKITDIGFVFKRNAAITSFDEFELFTGLKSLSDSAFMYCGNLTSIRLPQTVSIVGEHAFQDCSGLISVTLPDDLQIIGHSAFAQCGNLLLDKLPESLIKIDDAAFGNCGNLALTSLPESIVSIGNQAFVNCSNITLTKLPPLLKTIEGGTFANCSKVHIEELPQGLTTIKDGAFVGNGIERMTIPAGVNYIGASAFSGCESLSTVTVLATEPAKADDSMLGEYADVIYVPSASLEKYRSASGWSVWKDKFKGLSGDDPDPNPPVDPDPPVNPDPPVDGIIQFKDPAVKAICVANWDLNGDGELSVDEAEKVTGVGDVFRKNKEIVTFDEFKYFVGIEEIAETAFEECTNLVSIELPASITYIGRFAFSECFNLERVVLPTSLRIIDDGGFCNCNNLSLDKLPGSIVKLGHTVFFCCFKLKFTKLPPRLLSIGECAFAGCGELCLTELPSGIVSIGERAFEGCGALALQNLPDGVQRIEDSAFKYCYELRITELPSQLDSIERYAFIECRNIRLNKLPSNIKSIGESSFEGCSSLEINQIPDGVQKIGKSAFSGCTGIKSLVLPKELTKISSNTFATCHFKEITIQENVKLIESDAFIGCDRLVTVRLLPETPPGMLDENLGIYLDTIYVPAASLEAYRIAPGWSRWKDRIQPIASE